ELVELQAHALNNVGVVRVHTGDFGGVADLERAIKLATPLQSLELLRAYNNITGALFASGKPFREHEMELEGLRAAERLGMPRWIQNFRAEVAVRLLDTGEDWDEAMRLASGVIEAADARLATQGLARYVRSSIALARGNIEQALTDSSMNIEVLDRT